MQHAILMELPSARFTGGSQPPSGCWLGDPEWVCFFKLLSGEYYLSVTLISAKLRLGGCFLAVTAQLSQMLCLDSSLFSIVFQIRFNLVRRKITGSCRLISLHFQPRPLPLPSGPVLHPCQSVCCSYNLVCVFPSAAVTLHSSKQHLLRGVFPDSTLRFPLPLGLLLAQLSSAVVHVCLS